MEKNIVLGIDISKKTIDVFLVTESEGLSAEFSNNKTGFRKLKRWIKGQGVRELYACMEATGSYGDALCYFLHEEGHKVSVVNPYRVKCHGESRLRRNKTDKADAKLIADFCIKAETRLWVPPPEEVVYLQSLTRRIENLEKMKQMETNRLKTAVGPVRKSMSRHISNIKDEIKEVEKMIKQHFRDSPQLKHQKELLESIPGIAAKSAQLLLSEIIFERYDSAKQVAAQAGVTPSRNQSGTTMDKTNISRKGNKRLRTKLYYPAMTAIRVNPLVRDLANRMEERGKSGKVIQCAAIRKLLHIAFGIIKNNRPFDPNIATFA